MRIASIDRGTASSRCLLVENGGARPTDASRSEQNHPCAGWVEHHPEELLTNISQLFLFQMANLATQVI